ncbi:MAG: hypothetical protein ABI224_13405, partial [Acetobacteraceae bacterium]
MLSRAELRWCQFWNLRIEGARTRLQFLQASGSLSSQQDSAIVAIFNDNYVAPWNSLCGRYSFLKRDQDALELEIPARSTFLRAEGAKIIDDALAPVAAPEPTPTPAPAPAPAPAVQITPFDQGHADRNEWENWFATLTGPYREGAEWWAGARSLKSPGNCNDKIWAHGADFMQGCLAAQSRLTP